MQFHRYTIYFIILNKHKMLQAITKLDAFYNKFCIDSSFFTRYKNCAKISYCKYIVQHDIVPKVSLTLSTPPPPTPPPPIHRHPLHLPKFLLLQSMLRATPSNSTAPQVKVGDVLRRLSP